MARAAIFGLSYLLLLCAVVLANDVANPPPYQDGYVPVPIAELAAMKRRNEELLAKLAAAEDAADTFKDERDEALAKLQTMCDLVHQTKGHPYALRAGIDHAGKSR